VQQRARGIERNTLQHNYWTARELEPIQPTMRPVKRTKSGSVESDQRHPGLVSLLVMEVPARELVLGKKIVDA
jgi:hypothetical protein